MRDGASRGDTRHLLNNDASAHNISNYPEGSDEPVFEGEVCFGPDR